MTEPYLVIGHPIAHSLSPRIQFLFAQSTAIKMTYGRMQAPLNGFVKCVNTLVRDGLLGANVTRPFKFEALAIASHATERARLAGAANTLRFDVTSSHAQDPIWWADNTDGVGLVRDITLNAKVAIEGQKVLLIGAGGASSGVLGELIHAKPSLLVVANRTLTRATHVVEQHQAYAIQHGVELTTSNLTLKDQKFDIVINGSASSQDGELIPLSGNVLNPHALVVDMTYGQAALPFLKWANDHGAHGRDGLGMLVEQGAESFYFWHGVRPDGQSVLTQMRQELLF